MALLDSRQLNPRLTGSFTISGSLIGDTSSTGSFGELNVFGNSSILGDLTLGGDIQIGDSTGDSITITADFTSNLIPNVDNTFDLGSSVKNWRVGYIEQIVGETVTASGNISSSANITGNVVNVKTRVKAVGSSLEFAGDTLDFVDGNSTSRLFKGTAAGAFEAYHAGNKKLETTSAGIEVLGNVSGSATSTGSFGTLETVGEINASGRIFESGTSVIDHATAMAIVFGG